LGKCFSWPIITDAQLTRDFLTTKFLARLSRNQRRKDKHHHEGPGAATPQPKKKRRDHHEGHEEHEVSKFKGSFSESFVSFVCFVVVMVFTC
jgi:hypothetical protein